MSDFAHVELNTSDPEKARQFYGSLFGWQFEKMMMPGDAEYTMIVGADQPTLGLWRKPMPDAPDCWLGYVLVPSAPAAVAKAMELGAQVVAKDIVVPGIGEWAVLMDPMGAAFGVFAPENPPPAPKKAAKKPAKKAAKKPAKKAAKKPAKKAAKKPAKKAAKKPAKKAAKKPAKKAAKKPAKKASKR